MSMTYAVWRISYQSAEQAAIAAYDLAAQRWRDNEKLLALAMAIADGDGDPQEMARQTLAEIRETQ